MPRELVRDPEHDRARSLGWLATAWMEHFCLHGPGDVQGEVVVLDDELVELTVDVYALLPPGRRCYDSAFLSRPKGRDKSGHAGRHVLFEAFGPCRFAGWAAGGETFVWRDFRYAYQPGEPMGRPVTYPFIRCLATEEDQSGNTYDNVYFNLSEGPLSEGLTPNAVGITRTILPDGGEIRPSTASNAAKDGGKESFTVFDETHLYILPELRKMYNTVRRNCDKRKEAEPWTLETSTMYLPGEDSIAERSYKFAQQILEGKTRAKRFLFDHREAAADIDLTSETEIRAGLADVYGPFYPVMDSDRIVNSFWDPRNAPEDQRRYFFNQRTGAADSWLTEPQINGAVEPDLRVADGDAITLGFDGSRSRARGVTDATALVGCRVSDGYLFLVEVWEQPEGPAGEAWSVPKEAVDATVRATFEIHNVVGMYADPAKWESYIGKWEADFGRQLKVKSSQNHPIEWWMTGGRAHLIVRATERLHNGLVDGLTRIDGAAAFMRHLINARRRSGTNGIQIAKSTPESPNKIDIAVAAILANQCRADALAAGVTDKPKSRAVYGF